MIGIAQSLLVTALLVISAGSAWSQGAKFVELWTSAVDSLSLHGTAKVVPPLSSRDLTPLIVFIHDYRENEHAFDSLISVLPDHFPNPENPDSSEIYPTLLVVSLRGHGLSVKAGGDTLQATHFTEKEFALMPEDVTRQISDICTRNPYIDTNFVVLVGYGLGGNVAAEITKLRPSVKQMLLVSPALQDRGFKLEPILQEFAGRTLLVYTANDARREDCGYFDDPQRYPRVQHSLYDGYVSGSDIVRTNMDARITMREWIFFPTLLQTH